MCTIPTPLSSSIDSYASELDNWPADRSPVVSAAELEDTLARVPQRVKDDIQFQHDRVVEFAMEQRKSLHEFEVHVIAASCCFVLQLYTPADNPHNTLVLQVELFPGVKTGQRVIPVQSAGCYVPGGRFSHVSSAIMSVATAKVSVASLFLAPPNGHLTQQRRRLHKVAGVKNVVCCSPPLAGTDHIHPATLYAAHLAGADCILTMGGVQVCMLMHCAALPASNSTCLAPTGCRGTGIWPLLWLPC